MLRKLHHWVNNPMAQLLVGIIPTQPDYWHIGQAQDRRGQHSSMTCDPLTTSQH
jgi:hypothetical protein